MRCVHCGQANVCRPRGLCWGCYHEPGVRDSYGPIISHYKDHYGTMPLPAAPTIAHPGSIAKMIVMRERIARGEHLHHPDDLIGE